MNAKLQNVVENLEIMKELYDKKMFFTVMDSDSVIVGYAIPDGMTPQRQIGEVFRDPTGALDEVLAKGVKRHNVLPREVMGEAFEGNLIPIKDEGKVVGCVICTYSVEEKTHMQEIAEQFQESINEIDKTVQDIISETQNLSQILGTIHEKTSGVEHDANGAVDVVNKISQNASRSNILALNASIEAARSGEAGRGFSVVATEMGKLAKDSGDSASAIKTTLDSIVNHLETIISSIKGADSVAERHLESTASINDVLSKTLSLAQQMKDELQN